jgi:hypothetical protein
MRYWVGQWAGDGVLVTVLIVIITEPAVTIVPVDAQQEQADSEYAKDYHPGRLSSQLRNAK